MNKNKIVHNILITTSIAIALVFTYSAQAEMFKWRDSKGVMQYSNNPPPNSIKKKATPSEIVNSLQKKDLCAPIVAKNVATQKDAPQQSFFANVFTKSTSIKKPATNSPRIITNTDSVSNSTRFR